MNANFLDNNASAPTPAANQKEGASVRQRVENVRSSLRKLFSPMKAKEASSSCNSVADDDDINSDQQSFQSCTHDEVNDGLHDFQDAIRFPDGVCCYSVNDPTFVTSWSTVTYSHKTTKEGKKQGQTCLGIYKCPNKDCKFTSNPVVPRGADRKKNAAPQKCHGDGMCKVCCVKLVHFPCKAEITLVRSEGVTSVEHKGHHNHARPHEKLSKASKDWLSDITAKNSEARPSDIVRGTDTRLPAREVHEGFNNMGRVEYEMTKLKTKFKRSMELKDVPRWEEKVGIQFLKRATLESDKACVIMQFDEMKEITKRNGGTSSEKNSEAMVSLSSIAFAIRHSTSIFVGNVECVLVFIVWLSTTFFVRNIEFAISSRMCEVSTPFQLGRQSIFQLHFANACGLQ